MSQHAPSRTALICLEKGDAILSLEVAKAHLRVDFGDDDDLIGSLCATASGAFDGADGWLKRALLRQQWRLVLPQFRHLCRPRSARGVDGMRIDFPLPPLISVDAVRYSDLAGAEQTLDPSAYRLVGCGTEESFLVPVSGTSWPAPACEADAVRIDFTAGYGDAADDVPSAIVSAAKLLVGQLYEQRGAVVTGSGVPQEPPNSIKDLIANYRIVRT